jgi:hypothetical protein
VERQDRLNGEGRVSRRDLLERAGKCAVVGLAGRAILDRLIVRDASARDCARAVSLVFDAYRMAGEV